MVGGVGRQTKVTAVTSRVSLKFAGQSSANTFWCGQLIHVAERAGAGTARITTRTTRTAGSGRARRAFGGDGKNTELWAQLLALAFWTLGFVPTEDQRFKLVLTFLTDIFKNRHVESLPCEE